MEALIGAKADVSKLGSKFWSRVDIEISGGPVLDITIFILFYKYSLLL